MIPSRLWRDIPLDKVRQKLEGGSTKTGWRKGEPQPMPAQRDPDKHMSQGPRGPHCWKDGTAYRVNKNPRD